MKRIFLLYISVLASFSNGQSASRMNPIQAQLSSVPLSIVSVDPAGGNYVFRNSRVDSLFLPQGQIVGLPDSLLARYTKTQTDAIVSGLATTSALTSGLATKVNKTDVRDSARAAITAGTGISITNGVIANTSSGSVSSVGVSSSDFAVSGSPVTGSGNITLNLNTTGVSAGAYGVVTVDNKGRVSDGKRIEAYSGTTNGSGLYNVTFGTPYSVAPNIQAQMIGGTDFHFFRIVSVSTTGFSVYAYSRSAVTSLPIIGAIVGLLGSTATALSGANIDAVITEK